MDAYETIASSESAAVLHRHMIVVHLLEASRLAARMEEQMDVALFQHLMEMAIYAVQEHEECAGENTCAPVESPLA
jgi:hypothetical protein